MPIVLCASTLQLIDTAFGMLAESQALTFRRCYYQLVSKHIPNGKDAYQTLGRTLVKARKQNGIPQEWIEHRLRKPRHVPTLPADVLGERRRENVGALVDLDALHAISSEEGQDSAGMEKAL
jgi:hypothetical protein